MPRPNAGGGRNNQNNNDLNVPRRALFSSFASGKQGGKGKDKDKKGGEGKGKRERMPVFESQKEMDKWKGAQKGRSAPSSAAGPAMPQQGGGAEAGRPSIWQSSAAPSYVHATFCLTRDDLFAVEPVLNSFDPAAGAPEGHLERDVREEAVEHLRELGFLPGRASSALAVVAPQLLWEAAEKDWVVTARAAAERALEWLCIVTRDDDLPPKLRGRHEVNAWRKRQEDRNVALQTRALLLGGEINSVDITRIEKLGFSRAKAIEALSKSPGEELMTVVRRLLGDYLPLEPSAGGDQGPPSSAEELADEAQALQAVYGEDAVDIGGAFGSFEVVVALPGTEWRLVAFVPEELPYPQVSPLLCPTHPRLREQGRPKLLGALGDVCRETLGSPMLYSLCEWLISQGERFLVRLEDQPVTSEAMVKTPGLTPMQRSMQTSEEQRQLEAEAERVKAGRVAYLRQLQSEEQGAEASKLKDKIAIDIRDDPGSGTQHDLAGYDDVRARELVREAFGQPLVGSKMVRVTFVIGGGKEVRGRYPESLGKAFGKALEELGFAQDSTAALTMESGGSFKGQHDKERNLKLVHVFPRMVAAAQEAALDNESPADRHRRIAGATFADFLEEVKPLVHGRDTRAQAEALLHYLQQAAEDLRDADRKLRAGQQVGEATRRLYDELGGAEDVAERARWLAAELSPKPQRAPGAAHADGTTLDFSAPAGLEGVARGAAAAAAGGPAAPAEGDEGQLRRRIEQTRGESERLRAVFGRPKPLRETRQSLPAWAKREEIQRLVRDNQVVVVQGDTGCGKSTQVPQFILEDWVERGEAGAALMLMTQPRRISAIGVAERVAVEMDSPIGELAGYSIRLESKKSARTKILVCTTGVVLRRLEADRELRGVTHIVVDECHERDLDTDFLLIVLRDLLPRRPSLRIILMSATINAHLFCDYFGGCPSILIQGRTFPVQAHFLENALDHTGFVVEPNSEYSKQNADHLSPSEEAELRAMYEKDEFRELIGGGISRHAIVQLQRMDPEKINFDLVAAVVKHIHTQVDPVPGGPGRGGKRPGAILVFVPGFGEIKRCIRALGCDMPGQDDRHGKGKGGGKGGAAATAAGLWVLPLHSMISVAEQRLVFKSPEPGMRKVVVTTNIAETSITIDDVEYVVDCARHKQTKYDPQNRISMLVDCMETKANAKQRRGRAGRVKAGVCYHLVNVRKWKRMDDFEKPEMLRVPLDSLCLRVSLMGLGHPARFLAKALTPPTDAAVRSSLLQLVELSAVELQRKQEEEADAWDSSAAASLDREEQDRILKAKLRLTPLGAHLAQLPVDAGMGKLLVLGCLFGLPHDVCTLASALSGKSPFVTGVGVQQKDVDKRRMELSSKFLDGSLESDHLLLVSLFRDWERLGGGTGPATAQARRQWCRANGLDHQTFETMRDMRSHLLGTLVEQGFLPRDQVDARRGGGAAGAPWMPPCLASVATAGEEFDRRRRQLLRSLLCAALWPQVVLQKPGPARQLVAKHAAALAFHPSSIVGVQDAAAAEAAAGDWNCPKCTFFNFGSREFCLQCETPKPPPQKRAAAQLRHRAFMYAEKVRSVANRPGAKAQTYVRDCCGVSVKALFVLGHRVAVDYLAGRASVDGWIHCQAAARDAAMLLGLRRRLQEVLQRLLSKPSFEVPGGEDQEVINAVTSLLVMDIE